jgi:hypothetical protein
MAGPCCPKCLKKIFHRQNIHHLGAGVIYCVHCGTVVGAVPIAKSKAGGKTTGVTREGQTSQDAWEMPA